MAKLVSKTYGDALFELAVEENTMDATAKEAEAVLDAFAENEELLNLLNHPKVTREEKIKV
ncbi:MAG: F0F1 ATP synthase subunit delta, partial [Acetivibrio ethanolgignens]